MGKRVSLRITAVVLAAAGGEPTAKVTPTACTQGKAVRADALSANAYFTRGMIRSIKWLDLTSAQLRQIRAAVGDELPKTEPLVREFIRTRARLNSAMRQNRFDAEVLRLDARLSEITVELIDSKVRMYARIRTVLTERQRLKAETLINGMESYSHWLLGARRTYDLAA